MPVRRPKRKSKADQTLTESRDATQNMVALLQDADSAGQKTMTMLHEQGEQLNRAEDGLDKINEDMKEAEKNLNQMEKVCGIFTCPCGRKNAVIEPSKVFDEKRPDEKNGKTAVQKTELGKMKRIADDEREDEMDENLDQVGNLLDGMKAMATDMGDTIATQNDQIDRMNVKAESNSNRIKAANQRAQNILDS